MGQVTSYTWDGENRLTQVHNPDGTAETYSYDPDGLRQQKQAGSDTTQYVWDRQNVLRELDGSGAMQAQYTDYPGFWGGLTSVRSGSASQFYVFDSRANTRQLLSASATVDERYGYEAFGPEVSTSTPSTKPYRFGGQVGYYCDGAARLYVRFRHLEISTGRWQSPDPLIFDPGEVESINVYRYATNNPINWVDPLGLYKVSCFELFRLKNEFINLPLDTNERRKHIRRFYRAIATYLGERGYRTASHNFLHWLKGTGKQKELSNPQFRNDYEVQTMMNRVRNYLIDSIDLRCCTKGSKDTKHCVHVGVWPDDVDLMAAVGRFSLNGRLVCTALGGANTRCIMTW